MEKNSNKQQQQNVRDLINFFTNHKNLTRQQRARRDILLAKPYGGTDSDMEEKSEENQKDQHAPKNTAAFLALFNSPKGFKYLTHDFDPDSTMDFDKYLQQTQKVFQDKIKEYYPIPQSLYALMSTMLDKGKDWTDYNGKKHNSTYNSLDWEKWTKKNKGMHPLHNQSFACEIQAFRKTIRLVKPCLYDMVKGFESEFKSLHIETENLEKADFYTYVWRLKEGLRRILSDMSQYSTHRKVKISFERFFGDEYNLRIVKITQIGSHSSSFEDVLQKFKNGGGAFNGIKKCFIGYCNWSVEALWDNEPKRWNILDDSGKDEVQNIEIDAKIDGFTHILTFYSK